MGRRASRARLVPLASLGRAGCLAGLGPMASPDPVVRPEVQVRQLRTMSFPHGWRVKPGTNNYGFRTYSLMGPETWANANQS